MHACIVGITSSTQQQSDSITTTTSKHNNNTADLRARVDNNRKRQVLYTQYTMTMIGVKSNVLLLPVALLVAAASQWTAVAAAEDNSNNQCGMYIAISATSTVDDTKWGLYAGKEYPKGSQLGYPDVSINIFNLQGNARLAEETEDNDEDWALVQNTVEFFEQFIWVPIANAGGFELENGRTVTSIPGAGVLGGYNPKLTNADWNHSAAFFRPALGEQPGVNHPGRGAYSNFFNVALRSKDKITPGMEICKLRKIFVIFYCCCLSHVSHTDLCRP